jgi:hypothetical protein
MVVNLEGLRPEKDCADEVQQRLETVDPTSQRASHINKLIVV